MKPTFKSIVTYQRFFKLCSLGALMFLCSGSKKNSSAFPDLELKFLSEYVIPTHMDFENTVVGGLSSIDYDPETELYASISDDRSERNPARYYTYRIFISDDKIDSVIFLKKDFLRNKDNQPFPSLKKNKRGSVDPESLRWYGDKIIWGDEGLREVNSHDTALVNPRIFLSEKNGNFIDTLQTPEILHSSAMHFGPRNNAGYEGIAISPDKKYLMASVEEPLLQDGPTAALKDSSAIVRLIKFDFQTRKPVAQYAYRIEPVAHPPLKPGGLRLNGISEILYLDSTHLLVVERSYSMGNLKFTIRVFVADLSHATDISDIESMKGKDIPVVPKKLLLNTDNLERYIDNLEGVTFGPKLKDGNPSLIFISDDNFKILERTQILLFELKNK